MAKSTIHQCPFEKRLAKRRKLKKAIIAICSIVGVFAVLASTIAITNAVGVDRLIDKATSTPQVEYATGERLVPTKDEDGFWTFTTDRDFKIMQLTDIHIGGGFMSTQNDQWAMDAVATMILQEKPDLVVVTGDIAFPVPYISGTFNNLSGTSIFAYLMESLGVYWTFTFGNHDTEAYSYYSREELCQYYERRLRRDFDYCLFESGFSGDDKGYGNNVIKVKNSAGLVTQAIFTLDSHSYIDGDIFGIEWKYDNLHKSQVDWYKNQVSTMISSNKAINPDATTLDNIAFFHIPIGEYRDAWKERVEAGDKDTANVKLQYGNMGESAGEKNGVITYGIYSGMHNCEFFEAGLTSGLQATFCGHDHLNNFSVKYNGGSGDRYIQLTYGMSIDYLAYVSADEHEQRGCTIITLAPDGTCSITPKNYYTDYNGQDVGA
jgi:predicted MPP superfamily phosphohydrolase